MKRFLIVIIALTFIVSIFTALSVDAKVHSKIVKKGYLPINVRSIKAIKSVKNFNSITAIKGPYHLNKFSKKLKRRRINQILLPKPKPTPNPR